MSGGPHATDTRMEKKPVVWPVRSSAMLDGDGRHGEDCSSPLMERAHARGALQTAWLLVGHGDQPLGTRAVGCPVQVPV